MERRLGSGGDVGRSLECGERRPCRSMRCGNGVWRSILESESRASSSSTSRSKSRLSLNGWVSKGFEDPDDLFPLRLLALERDWGLETQERGWLERRGRGRERGRGVAWMIAETSGLAARSKYWVGGKGMGSSEGGDGGWSGSRFDGKVSSGGGKEGLRTSGISRRVVVVSV